MKIKLKNRFVKISLNLFLLSILSFLNLSVFVKPAFAQSADCDCYFQISCDIATGAINPGGSGTMYCAGKLLNPTTAIGDGSPAGAGECYISPSCGTHCTPCRASADFDAMKDQDKENKFFCEGGAYCRSEINLAAVTQYAGTRGLWSTLFHQCYCGYEQIIQTLVNIGYTVIGALSVAMFSIGAFKYITARNDPEKLTDAKHTIAAAVAGFLLVLLSVVILRFLEGQLDPWGIHFLQF